MMRLIVFFLLFGFTIKANATESDPYTFFDIQLKDSANEINVQLNRQMQTALEQTNSWISGKKIEDKQIVAYFFGAWQKSRLNYLLAFELRKFVKSLFISFDEMCFFTNDCEGWGKIERILLYPGESIFHEANYNLVTKTYLSPIINLCGYRVGADKVTHFTEDGLQYFKGWMRGMPMQELAVLSWETEAAALGQTYTEVMSRADHRVNMIGINFYRTFFAGNNPILFMGQNQQLQVRRAPNICDYVNEAWDETTYQNENIYTGHRAPQMLNAIKNRKLNPNAHRFSKEAIIGRSYKSLSFWDELLAGGTGVFYKPADVVSIPFAVNKEAVFKLVSMPDVDPKSMIPEGHTIRRDQP